MLNGLEAIHQRVYVSVWHVMHMRMCMSAPIASIQPGLCHSLKAQPL